MKISQFKPFKQYSFYDDSIYNQIFENVTPSSKETLLYSLKKYDLENTKERLKSNIRTSFVRYYCMTRVPNAVYSEVKRLDANHTHFLSVPRLRMSGVIPPSPYTFLWLAQLQLYLLPFHFALFIRYSLSLLSSHKHIYASQTKL